jgi:hypothetical protein
VPEILKTVGRYEILREVGRGGMAVVYLARQTDLDRFVALKELAAFHASDAQFAQRFLRESRVAGSLSHPNIVTVHDYFEHEGTPYIAMEYVERGSLRPFIGNMTTAQIGGVLEGLLAGLALAEQHGIVHRDLKPENLMVTSDGRVKIADFGIAKATNQMQTGAFLTATGTTVGTPTYMAPEQAMAQEIGPWTDLYSVGCMAFEMLTGRVPFHDSDAPMAILLRHVNEEIPPVSSIEPSVDHGVSDWVEQLLVKDPKARTQSANEAWDEFEELIIGLQGPRWRRGARLAARSEQVDTPKPLTPAPFEGPPAGETADEFQSFAWGEPVREDPPGATAAPPGPATPPPADAPSGPLEPGPIDVPTGPPTPPPLEQVGEDSGFLTFGAPSAPAEPEAPEQPATPEPPATKPEPPATTPEPAPAEPEAADPDFLTFGAPAPPEPVAEPAQPEPAAAQPAEPEPEPIAPEPEEPAAPAFETYVAPPPLRPPADEAPAREAPPVTEPEPAPEPAPAPEPRPEPEPVAAATTGEDGGATVMPEALRREREEHAAPPAAREERRRGWVFPVVLGAGVVLAIIAGLVFGGGGGDDGGGGGNEGGGAPAKAVSAGPLSLKVPSGYAEMSSAPATPGLELADAAAYAPGGKDGGRAVTFGLADANDSTLLTQDFRTALGLGAGEVPDRTAVKLGPDELQAYRYADLAPAGTSRRMTLYAAPTTAGVATVACLAPPADAKAFKPECEAIANTLQLESGQGFPVGPDPGYAKTLSTTLTRLDRRVASGRKALARDGTTFKQQAAAARGIQAAYGDAAKALAKAETSPADELVNQALVQRLKAAGAAWKPAAAAAADKDKQGFARASAAIRRTQDQLRRQLAALERIGYQLGG